MTQDIKKDTILHTITKRLVRNWRTQVRLGAHSRSLTGALRTMHLLLILTLGTTTAWAQTPITELSEITDANGHYIITKDITGGSPGVSTFSGTLEANINPTTKMPYRIKNLSAPLFTTLTGTVKNLVLENVNITSGTNVGAIACNMIGTSEKPAYIYNCGLLGSVTRTYDQHGELESITCSSSVSGSGAVGGLVGVLGQDGNNDNCYARVINCYSFAKVSGGSGTTGGIVGKNCFSSTTGNIRTMVMNCMFYGTGSGISPIYGGSAISNDNTNKLNNYNYFCYENLPSGNIASYNCALAAEERYLIRFEFYRHLLNSTRELAAYYVDPNPETIRVSNKDHKRYHVDLMAKWVLDKSIAFYPILKVQGTYPSVVNYEDVPTLGTLSVSINLGSNAPAGATVSGTSLPIYDKDPENYHFNYRTVRLPYYHEVGTGNYTSVSGTNYYKAVTGWKITGMTGGTPGTFTAADEWGGYNFADRSTYAKDIYNATTNPRVFSQGAYFDVPDGVTGITIEPYWGNAVFLSDPYYDKYGYAAGNVEDYGLRYNNGSTYTFGNLSLKVYTGISNALKQLPDASSVYDNAVVLVGNYHKGGNGELSDGSKNTDGSDNMKAFTIMSIDLNEDNEPDYSLIYRSGKQNKFAPIRFDFINVPGMAMAHKTTSDANMGIPGNAKLAGWFEVTNTALIHYSQFEYDSENKSGSHPVILLGGVFEQIVSTNGSEGCLNNKTTKYIHVGSNVWFKLFNNGCHLDKTNTKTPRVPISVTGGDYDKFYLSGYFQPEAPVFADNAECYISGGHFGEVAGAGQEPINGDVQWMIDHADIDNFYGGGINDQKPITGKITVTIKDSKVGTYCGGPKFGNMSADQAVSTTATGCTFDNFYGAGFGGTSYYRYLWNGKTNHNQYESVNYVWNGSTWVGHTTYGFTSGTRGKYVNGRGILVSYDYEHFEGSSTNTVARLYMLYASLSLAQTKDVTSILTGCTINQNFYGGGKLGSVDGNIVSSLTDCTVKGNVFGAGYSGTPPSLKVFSTDGTSAGGFKTIPNYNTTTGVFEKGVYPDGLEYTWSTKGSVTDGSNSGSLTDDSEGHWIHTDNLSNLGSVIGNVTLTIKGDSRIEGKVFNEDGTVKTDEIGGVYGGGEKSAVTGSDYSVTVNIEGSATVLGNVFGGGKDGIVEGNTVVNIDAPTSTP
ncbi:MAG: hypothetical protein J5658_03155 [Prevotella sp.]|nr:hypothetical protein [Prevotella sp.]